MKTTPTIPLRYTPDTLRAVARCVLGVRVMLRDVPDDVVTVSIRTTGGYTVSATTRGDFFELVAEVDGEREWIASILRTDALDFALFVAYRAQQMDPNYIAPVAPWRRVLARFLARCGALCLALTH